MYDSDQWQNKVSIITGAASGIGLATAKKLAANGSKVLGVDLPNSNLTQSLAGSEVVPFAMDLTRDEAPQLIVNEVLQKWGRLDILANIAGIARNTMFQNLADQQFQEVLDVNLIAPMRLCREAVPHLKASGCGRIVNITSIMAKFTDKGLASYSAAKAGLAGLTRNLAYELAFDNITVNHIMPGAIVTGMTKGFENPEIAEIWRKKAALRRLGEPQDIANVIIFLTSQEAGFITGQGIGVDGGMMLRV